MLGICIWLEQAVNKPANAKVITRFITVPFATKKPALSWLLLIG
jgi:hypothetical protein